MEASEVSQTESGKVWFFPLVSRGGNKITQAEVSASLDKAAAKMLDYTLTERKSLCAKLCSKAEKLNDEVEREAMTKWIESQETTWNRWDHLYKVKANAKVD